ncbi:MAG: tetratricopeptide repeat protein [Candidatus Solibacter sp.]
MKTLFAIVLLLASNAVGQEQDIQAVLAGAQKGDAEAQVVLGIMYATGEGVAQSDAEAVRWYRKAADGGNAQAQTNLGTMFCEGRGVPKDCAEGSEWFRIAADHGYTDAQALLGLMYSEGQGVKQDYTEAFRWYRKAALQGHADAQYHLAVLLVRGLGVTRNYSEAAIWCSKAAEQGHAEARRDLSEMSPTGKWATQASAEVPRVGLPATAPATLHDYLGRFSLEIPSGWKAKVVTSDSLVLVPVAPGGVSLTVKVLPGSDAKRILETNSQIGGPRRYLHGGSVRFSGQYEPYRMYQGKNAAGVEEFVRLVAASFQGQTYLLTSSAPAAEFDRLWATFDQIERSFTLVQRSGGGTRSISPTPALPPANEPLAEGRLGRRQSQTTYDDPESRFTVGIPEGWKAMAVGADSVLIEPVVPGAGYVAISVQARESMGTLESGGSLGGQSGYVSGGPLRFAGRDGQYARYQLTNPTGLTVDMRMVAVSDQGNAYRLTTSAPAAQFDHFQGIFEQIERSFTIIQRGSGSSMPPPAPPTSRVVPPPSPSSGPKMVREGVTRIWSNGKEFARLDSDGVSVAASLDKYNGVYLATVTVANASSGTIDVLPARFSLEIGSVRHYPLSKEGIQQLGVPTGWGQLASGLGNATLLNSCSFQGRSEEWRQNCVAEKQRQIQQEQAQRADNIRRLQESVLMANTIPPSRSVSGAVYFGVKQIANGQMFLDIPIGGVNGSSPTLVFRFAF